MRWELATNDEMNLYAGNSVKAAAVKAGTAEPTASCAMPA